MRRGKRLATWITVVALGLTLVVVFFVTSAFTCIPTVYE